MRQWLIILAGVVMASIGRAAPVTELPWSFEPLAVQLLPKIKNASWPQARLDHFTLAQIESKRLQPARAADDRVLLRRLYFDLIGLPPTPEQLADFRKRAIVNRKSAIENEINALLASPHYGERWARHWLDLARYTDKTAKWLNSTAAAWRYRDWVVAALNRDLPYNTFVKQQLANDLIEGSDPKDNAALGFLGLSPTYWKELQLPPEIIKTTVADEWEERMDAAAGVRHRHDHIVARFHAAVHGRVLRVDGDLLGGDAEDAAVGHGVAGVDAKVEQNLVELGGVAGDELEFLRDPAAELDVLGEGVLDDPLDLPHDVPDLQADAQALDAPGEGEDLLDELRAPLGAALDGVDDLPALGPGLVAAKERNSHHDGGQQVVEVVRDSARQGADAFEALRAQELEFEFFAFGDVRADGKDGLGRPGVVTHEGPPGEDGERVAGLVVLLTLPLPLA